MAKEESDQSSGAKTRIETRSTIGTRTNHSSGKHLTIPPVLLRLADPMPLKDLQSIFLSPSSVSFRF